MAPSSQIAVASECQFDNLSFLLNLKGPPILDDFLFTRPKTMRTYLSFKPPIAGSLTSATLLAGLFGLVSVLTWLHPEWSDSLSASREQVFGHHQYWRLFTALFVHANAEHLFANVPLFLVFGSLVFGYFGFWAFPVGAMLAGALANALTIAAYPAHARLIGASGVVYFLCSFWLVMYFLIQHRLSWGGRLLRALGVATILLLPELYRPEVSYLAHAWGAALAVPIGIAFFIAQRPVIRAIEHRWEESDRVRRKYEDWQDQLWQRQQAELAGLARQALMLESALESPDAAPEPFSARS